VRPVRRAAVAALSIVPHSRRSRQVTSVSVLITRARGVRLGGMLAGGAAAAAMGVVGCTSVTGGDPTVDAADAPAYRTSMSVSSSQAAASSSARESERQASMTTQAIQATCETLSTTSADAIDAVNAYVDAFNSESGDVSATEGPAVDALDQSAQAVESSISEMTPDRLAQAFAGWADGAKAAADAISNQAPPDEFNRIIDELNTARSEALGLCDAMYR